MSYVLSVSLKYILWNACPTVACDLPQEARTEPAAVTLIEVCSPRKSVALRSDELCRGKL